MNARPVDIPKDWSEVAAQGVEGGHRRTPQPLRPSPDTPFYTISAFT